MLEKNANTPVPIIIKGTEITVGIENNGKPMILNFFVPMLQKKKGKINRNNFLEYIDSDYKTVYTFISASPTTKTIVYNYNDLYKKAN